jgi:hypothetical protein
MKAKATLHGTLLAETSTWEEVEGNIYVAEPLIDPGADINLINNP